MKQELTSYFFLFFAFHTDNTWIYPCKILKCYRRISLKSHCPPSLPVTIPSLSPCILRVNNCYNVVATICCRKNSSVSQEWKITNLFLPQTLKFLEKCRKKKKIFAPWQGLQDLTDARRVELKQQVDDYLRRHPVCRLLCHDISVSSAWYSCVCVFTIDIK